MAYLVKGDPPPAREEGAISPDPTLPRVCVIGAGPSGIAQAKALYEARVPFDCFEMGPYVGGNWVFENPNGQSACYRTLEINSSRRRSAFSDFPMPDYFPNFPMHWQMREYFDSYVDHFGFRDTITFETKVEHVRPREDGAYEVEISGAGASGGRETRAYDAVVVGNGHHWDRRWPEPPFPGSFDGEVVHAHDFTDDDALEGKRVVVVGGGNSGMDISVAASYWGEAAFHSLRRGVHVLRKHVAGRPIDENAPPPWLPWPVKQRALEVVKRLSGDPTEYGMPEPDHKVGHAHPTVSDEYLDRLADGSIAIKPNIEALEGDSVRFADGSVERVDLIVYCTGYRISFPFFDEEFFSAPGNELNLYRRVFPPHIPGLAFIGFVQPLGSIFPIAEAQARWVAELYAGIYRLPGEAEMRAEIEARREADRKRYYGSPRHTIQIDFDEYLIDLERERRAGRERAIAHGFKPQVPARVEAEAMAA